MNYREKLIFEEAHMLVFEMHEWWTRHGVTAAWFHNDDGLRNWMLRAGEFLDTPNLPLPYKRLRRTLQPPDTD